MSPEKFEQLKEETSKDEELRELKYVIVEGWPDTKQQLKECIKPYYKYRTDLTVVNKVVFKNNQLVIPKSMRTEIIEKLHYNHLGIQKTFLKAREHVFLPFMMI